MKRIIDLFLYTFLFLLFVVPSSFAGHDVEVKNGHLTIGGYLQHRYFQQLNRNKLSYFETGKVRFGLDGSMNRNTSYRVQLDFMKDPILLDAYVDLKIFKSTNFRVGQFKVPFSTEQLLEASDTPFINRSNAVRQFSPERDLGFQFDLYLFDEKVTFISGVFNGTGMEGSDTDSQKDFAFRGVAKLMEGLYISGNYTFLNEHDFDNNSITSTQDADLYSGSLYFTRNERFTGGRVGGEYIVGKYPDATKNGFYIMSGYHIKPHKNYLFPKIEFLARYGIFDPDTSVDNDEEKTFTGGITVYIAGLNSKLQLNYSTSHVDLTGFSKDELLAQVQIQF